MAESPKTFAWLENATEVNFQDATGKHTYEGWTGDSYWFSGRYWNGFINVVVTKATGQKMKRELHLGSEMPRLGEFQIEETGKKPRIIKGYDFGGGFAFTEVGRWDFS